jgi:hypothetical protein
MGLFTSSARCDRGSTNLARCQRFGELLRAVVNLQCGRHEFDGFQGPVSTHCGRDRLIANYACLFQSLQVRLFYVLVAALGLALSEPASAALHVKVTPGPSHSPACTFWGDAMLLTVSDGNRRLVAHRYCSAYGKGRARLVRDLRGHPYVFLNHSITHGSHATSDLLSIYRVGKALVKRARLPVSVPIGSVRDAEYSYEIRRPRRGGLELIGSVRVVGEASDLDVAPERPQRLSIDPSLRARR